MEVDWITKQKGPEHVSSHHEPIETMETQMRNRSLGLVTLLVVTLLPSSAAAQSSGGTQCAFHDFNQFFWQTFEHYTQLTNQTDDGLGRALTSMLQPQADEMVRTCPGYVSRVLDNEEPSARNEMDSEIGGALMDLLLRKDESYQDLKREFPAFRRWMRRIRDRVSTHMLLARR